MRAGKKLKAIAASAAMALVIGACAGGGAGGSSSGSSSGKAKSAIAPIEAPMPAVPEGLARYYSQGVTWKECGDGLECGRYTVPLNYAEPSGKVIHIAVTRRAADKERVGALLVNPGGPGGAGQELAEIAEAYFPQPITDHFDIIGFDPRGVGESEPVDCVSDAELSRLLEASYPDTPAGQAASMKDAQVLAAGCEAKSGELLPFVGTENAARDMDIIRHVEGDPKLYYVGFSYGTSLGAEYADLFPDRVGRMVLDGAVASRGTNYEAMKQQLMGFENALDMYLKDCLENNAQRCPFKGSVADAREQIAKLFEQALREPLPTSDPDRPLTESGLLYGIVTPLYSAAYSILTNAFSDLIEDGDASAFYTLFDAYLERDSGKFLSNSMEANFAINCADYPAEGDEADWREYTEDLKQAAPLFGPVYGYNDAVCAAWPYQAPKRLGNYEAKGSDPIVVLGTSGDPATPYVWAQDLADSLDNAVLVTWEGEGHTAYTRSTDCISDPVNAYLLSGVIPEDGLTCSAK